MKKNKPESFNRISNQEYPEPDTRAAILRSRQNYKMSRSAHAYVRGSTAKFYEWIKTHEIDVPQGPPIWICGDCHTGNLGPIASVNGDLKIQIRDLDQTVLGNPAWDLLRLLLSLASAARSMDLAGVTTLHMIEAACKGYAYGLRNPYAAFEKTDLLKQMMRSSARRASAALAQERLMDLRPSFPLGKDFWPLSDVEIGQVQQIFSGDIGAARLNTLLGLGDLVNLDRERPALLDMAYWVKGCSSLGLTRVAVLVATGNAAKSALDTGEYVKRKANARLRKSIARHWADGEIRLIDIKQAVQPLAPLNTSNAMPEDFATRVLSGASALTPHLASRMATARLGGRSVFIRELMPQDLKLSLVNIDNKEAVDIAQLLARVVGQAHGSQMSTSDRQEWGKAVKSSQSKSLNAPSWTWTGVRDLMAVHEAAYLDHCRRYGQYK